MYAILHIPTGCIMHFAKTNSEMPMLPLDYIGHTLFYSKKDAEKYKRKFLCFYYFVIVRLNSNKFPDPTWISPKYLPKFAKKRNRFGNHPMTYAAFDFTCRTFEFYYPTKRSGTPDNKVIPLHYSEFIVVKSS